MDYDTIKKTVESFGDEWYYYYNFDGVEVCKKLKNDKTSGMYNWKNKVKPIIKGIINDMDTDEKPCVFNIGCNMCLYDHEMTKMGIKVYGIDKNVDIARFFKRYVKENLQEEWEVDLRKMDVTKDELHVLLDVDIITMFCVIYHLRPHIDKVMNKFSRWFPNHKYLVLQGNKPRVKKKKRPQPEAGVDGMKAILIKYGYYIHSVYEWSGYQKPIVIGGR